MKRILSVILFAVFVLGFATETLAQKPERERLKLSESEVSFEGDDSFITGRFITINRLNRITEQSRRTSLCSIAIYRSS